MCVVWCLAICVDIIFFNAWTIYEIKHSKFYIFHERCLAISCGNNYLQALRISLQLCKICGKTQITRKAWTTLIHGLQNNQLWASAQDFKTLTCTLGDFKKLISLWSCWAIAHKSMTFNMFKKSTSWEVLKPRLTCLKSVIFVCTW